MNIFIGIKTMDFYINISHYCSITVGAVSAVLAATSHYCWIAFDAESAVLAVTSLVDS